MLIHTPIPSIFSIFVTLSLITSLPPFYCLFFPFLPPPPLLSPLVLLYPSFLSLPPTLSPISYSSISFHLCPFWKPSLFHFIYPSPFCLHTCSFPCFSFVLCPPTPPFHLPSPSSPLPSPPPHTFLPLSYLPLSPLPPPAVVSGGLSCDFENPQQCGFHTSLPGDTAKWTWGSGTPSLDHTLDAMDGRLLVSLF